MKPVSEFNEFEPCLKSAKNRFRLSIGLNLETLNTILSKTAIFERGFKFKPPRKFFKFGLRAENFKQCTVHINENRAWFGILKTIQINETGDWIFKQYTLMKPEVETLNNTH